MYGSASARKLSQGVPLFTERQLTEDGEGIRIEVGSGEDFGRLASVADDFRIVIKGDGIRDKVCAEVTRDQYRSSLGGDGAYP